MTIVWTQPAVPPVTATLPDSGRRHERPHAVPAQVLVGQLRTGYADYLADRPVEVGRHRQTWRDRIRPPRPYPAAQQGVGGPS